MIDTPPLPKVGSRSPSAAWIRAIPRKRHTSANIISRYNTIRRTKFSLPDLRLAHKDALRLAFSAVVRHTFEAGLFIPTEAWVLESKFSFMPKVGFVSLGCPKNLVDSEVMMGTLAQSGYEITSDAS